MIGASPITSGASQVTVTVWYASVVQSEITLVIFGAAGRLNVFTVAFALCSPNTAVSLIRVTACTPT